MDKKKLFMIVSIAILAIAVIGGASTYAWYIWSTDENNETKIVTNIGTARVFYNGGANIENAVLKPTANRLEDGIVKDITVKTDKETFIILKILTKKQIKNRHQSLFYYIVSTNVSSRHLSMHTHPKLIVKKEFVLSYGNTLVVSVFGAKTLNVAQQPSSFSNLNTVLVVVTAGSLLIGIARASFPEPQV